METQNLQNTASGNASNLQADANQSGQPFSRPPQAAIKFFDIPQSSSATNVPGQQTYVSGTSDAGTQPGTYSASNFPGTVSPQPGTQNPTIAPMQKPKRSWGKIGILLALLLLVIGGMASGAVTLNTYDKYSQKIPLLKLLPANPNMVLTVPTNPDAQQFASLETHLKKFPGYDLVKKSLDKTGKGKTVSQIIQEKLAKYNLNFQDDLKPAIAPAAYIAIADISPLGSELQKNAILTFGNQLEQSLTGKGSEKYALASSQDALETPTKIRYATSIEQQPKKDFMFPALDFVAATEITNITKAREVFEKIKTNDQFSITKKTFAGYDYYAAQSKQTEDNKDDFYTNIYSAIIGKNLIVSSKEDNIKFAISNANNIRILGFLHRSTNNETLADSKEFQTISSQVNDTETNNRLLSLYLKFNFNSFFKSDACNPDVDLNCVRITDYFKYPSDIVVGLDLVTNGDGIGIGILSNERDFSGSNNIPFSEGLSKRVPQLIDGRYANIFVEHTNINDLYYAFKKNNLTDKGLQKWNGFVAEVSNLIGFNPEIDFIDQIDGKSGVIVYTNATTEPEGALIMHVKDPQKAYAAIEKFTELIKKSLMSLYSVPQNDFGQSASMQLRKMAAENEKRIATLKAIGIVATDTENGKVYSFKIPNTPLSFDFSLENNELILGSHNAAVVKLLEYAKAPHQDALDSNQLYLRAKQYSQKEGFAQTFVAPQAVTDIISYFQTHGDQLIAQSMGETSSPQPQKNCSAPYQTEKQNCIEPEAPTGLSPASPSEIDEGLYAFGAILRTVPFFNSTSSIQNTSVKSTMFFDIKELPAEEKARAEKTLSDWASSEPSLNF